jgi:hypothetical protein
MGKRNIYVDLVDLFSYAGDGEFIEWVHQIPFDPGGSCNFRPDYPVSFCLKSFPKGYTKTSLILPWTR